MSLVLLCTAIATPLLAGKFIGGGVHQAISHGMNTATGLASNAKSLVTKGHSGQSEGGAPRGGDRASDSGPTNLPAASGLVPRPSGGPR
jgi:hypothetical protein